MMTDIGRQKTTAHKAEPRSTQRLVRRIDLGLVTRLVREIDHEATGQLMRAGRKRSGISLREMGRRLKCSAQFVSDLELGRRKWTEERIEQWAAILCPSNIGLCERAKTRTKHI